MRREGYEFMISPPRIVTSVCPDSGKKMEPFEEVTVDVDAEHSGTVVNALTGARKGVLLEMAENSADGKTRLVFDVPSRGLLGFGPEIATLTRGTAVVHHCYLEDREFAGNLGVGLEKSKLVSNEQGKATLYALASLADRGTLFVDPGDLVRTSFFGGIQSRDTWSHIIIFSTHFASLLSPYTL
jgi:GTP-binding protein